MAMENSYSDQCLWNLPFESNIFSSSKSDEWKYAGKRNIHEMEVEIISEEYIKPESPTPDHLRKYEVSVLDQIHQHIYMPVVYFYPNNNQIQNEEYLISKRRQLLKHSLSETLTSFYPLAGRYVDSKHIDCNDDGVYYVEAKVRNILLNDFLKHPDDKSIHRFLPVNPNSTEILNSKTDMAMVQITIFSCGGIAIGLYTSHKIIDGYSASIFIKAWAATASGSSEKVHPSFISPSIFPPNHALPETATLMMLPMFKKHNKIVTKRFLFRASSIASLKKRVGGPFSRVIAITGLIWKCVMATSKGGRSSSLAFSVNIRQKISSPPLPPYAIGNIIWTTARNNSPTQCNADDDLDLGSIVRRLKDSIDLVDSDFVDKMKGQEWSLKVEECVNELKVLHSKENTDYMTVASVCNGRMYESDFGWGKPIWISVGNANTDTPFLANLVLLMDTRSGKGVEAWVTLSEEEMIVLENDPELLAFASVNPSPLEIDD